MNGYSEGPVGRAGVAIFFGSPMVQGETTPELLDRCLSNSRAFMCCLEASIPAGGRFHNQDETSVSDDLLLPAFARTLVLTREWRIVGPRNVPISNHGDISNAKRRDSTPDGCSDNQGCHEAGSHTRTVTPETLTLI